MLLQTKKPNISNHQWNFLKAAHTLHTKYQKEQKLQNFIHLLHTDKISIKQQKMAVYFQTLKVEISSYKWHQTTRIKQKWQFLHHLLTRKIQTQTKRQYFFGLEIETYSTQKIWGSYDFITLFKRTLFIDRKLRMRIKQIKRQ